MGCFTQVNFVSSKLTSLGPQLLNTVESKQRHIELMGLADNPIFCDCNTRALQRWLKDKENQEPDVAKIR